MSNYRVRIKCYICHGTGSFYPEFGIGAHSCWRCESKGKVDLIAVGPPLPPSWLDSEEKRNYVENCIRTPL